MRTSYKYIVLAGLAILVTVSTLIISQRSNPFESKKALSKTQNLITDAKYKLNNDPNNPDRYTALCQLYLQKIREDADTSSYATCDDLLTKATAITPNNAEVIATQASVAYGKHLFTDGLELSKKAQELNPDQVSYYGLIGDGQLELGQYDEAVKSIQTMVTKKPELSSFNRVAFIREIYGDIEGAKAALVSAVSAGSAFPENVAFSQVELGKLHMRNDLDKAEHAYQEALQTYPDYSPASEGLGKVAFARNDYTKAEKYFQEAFDNVPLAQYAKSLADTYKAAGNTAKADQQYFLAELAFQKSTSGGVNNDYELATFLAQQNKEGKKSTDLARKAYVERPNIFSADTLAWALFRGGNYTEAQTRINEALRLGEHEPVIVYHAGRIAEKLGKNEQAKTYLQQSSGLDRYFLESHFSLLDRKEANEALERLQ